MLNFAKLNFSYSHFDSEHFEKYLQTCNIFSLKKDFSGFQFEISHFILHFNSKFSISVTQKNEKNISVRYDFELWNILQYELIGAVICFFLYRFSSTAIFLTTIIFLFFLFFVYVLQNHFFARILLKNYFSPNQEGEFNAEQKNWQQDSKLCPACGAILPEDLNCVECGLRISDKKIFSHTTITKYSYLKIVYHYEK